MREAADLLLATSQTGFSCDAREQVMGCWAGNLLLRGTGRERRPEAYVAGVMDREFPRVQPDMALSEAVSSVGEVRLLRPGDG